MGLVEIGFGVAFPVLVGIGVALAVADASDIEFWFARGCFIVAALDVMFFTVKWLWFSEELAPRDWTVGAAIAAAALVALVIGLRWIDYRAERISAQLVPGTKPMPPLPPGCNPPADGLVVWLGTNVAWGTRFPYTVLNIGGVKMLAVDKVAGKPKLNINVLRIFDDRGTIIARIDEDGFWVSPDMRHVKPNRSTLVVYDRADQQALKIEFLNPRALYVEGIFRDRKGVTVRITPDSMILPGDNIFSQSCIAGAATAIRIN